MLLLAPSAARRLMLWLQQCLHSKCHLHELHDIKKSQYRSFDHHNFSRSVALLLLRSFAALPSKMMMMNCLRLAVAAALVAVSAGDYSEYLRDLQTEETAAPSAAPTG
jgi:hypothetical protein